MATRAPETVACWVAYPDGGKRHLLLLEDVGYEPGRWFWCWGGTLMPRLTLGPDLMAVDVWAACGTVVSFLLPNDRFPGARVLSEDDKAAHPACRACLKTRLYKSLGTRLPERFLAVSASNRQSQEAGDG